MRINAHGQPLVSDSSLEMHRHCSAKYWFHYLEKPIREPRVVQFEFGSLVHKMFEDFFKRKNPTARMYESAKDFANVFRGKWQGIDYMPKDPSSKKHKLGPLIFKDRDYPDPNGPCAVPGCGRYATLHGASVTVVADDGTTEPSAEPTPAHPYTAPMKHYSEKTHYLYLGTKICRKFFEDNQKVPPSHVLVEHGFNLEITDPETGHVWTLNGFIDRVELQKAPCCLANEHGPEHWDYSPERVGWAVRAATSGELFCVDYKTSKVAPDQSSLDGDTQFTMYDLALEELFPAITTRRFAIHNVPNEEWRFTARNAVDRGQLMRRIYDEIREIEREQYSFLGDMYVCKMCPYLKPCGELRDWARNKGVDPEMIMRREAPLRAGSLRHITWKDGRIVAVNEPPLTGDPTVFGYGRHLMEGAIQAPAEVHAPIPESVPLQPRKKKGAEQLSLL